MSLSLQPEVHHLCMLTNTEQVLVWLYKNNILFINNILNYVRFSRINILKYRIFVSIFDDTIMNNLVTNNLYTRYYIIKLCYEFVILMLYNIEMIYQSCDK